MIADICKFHPCALRKWDNHSSPENQTVTPRDTAVWLKRFNIPEKYPSHYSTHISLPGPQGKNTWWEKSSQVMDVAIEVGDWGNE